MVVLGIDVGTGGTRALLIDEKGRVVRSATEEHEPFASPQIGWAEQRPEDWWRACGIAVRKVLAAANLSGEHIACVGFSGQMHGAVMLDEADRVVRPALDLVRRPHGKTVPRLYAESRRGAADPAYLQSGIAEFHADKISVGAGKRTRQLAPRPLCDAPQRLRALPPDRQPRNRRGGCLRHAPSRCREPTMVP